MNQTTYTSVLNRLTSKLKNRELAREFIHESIIKLTEAGKKITPGLLYIDAWRGFLNDRRTKHSYNKMLAHMIDNKVVAYEMNDTAGLLIDLSGLSHTKQSIIALCLAEDFDKKEIEKKHGVNPETLKSHILQSVILLRKKYNINVKGFDWPR